MKRVLFLPIAVLLVWPGSAQAQEGQGTVTLTVPAATKQTGLNGTYFSTDLWLLNRSFTSEITATLTYRCASSSPSCPIGNATTVPLAPRESMMLSGVIGRFDFAENTNGAIEISWPASSGPISASSKVSTLFGPSYRPVNAPLGFFGSLVPALPSSSAKMNAVFVGVQSGGVGFGSRSNAGAYNPQPTPVGVTFTLHNGDGSTLGTLTRTYQPNEADQLSPNIFDLLGVGSTITENAYVVVTATAPVFSYVIVIDNVSGDPSFLPASDDEPS